MKKETLSRRSFFKFAFTGLAVLPLVAQAAKTAVSKVATKPGADACPKTPPAGKPIAKVGEGIAKALKYSDNAKDFNAKNNNKFPGSSCSKCMQYTKAEEKEGYAPCKIMPGKGGPSYVSNCGLCMGFVKKPV